MVWDRQSGSHWKIRLAKIALPNYAADTALSDEVKDLRLNAQHLKEVVAEQMQILLTFKPNLKMLR